MGRRCRAEITRWSVAAILALGAPLAYLVAAVNPQSARQPEDALQAQAAPASAAAAQATAGKLPVSDAPPVKPSKFQPGPDEWQGDGNAGRGPIRSYCQTSARLSE